MTALATAAAATLWAGVAVDREVGRRVEEVNEFSELTFEGMSHLLNDVGSAPFLTDGSALAPADLNGLVEGGDNRLRTIEVYTRDGARAVSTTPSDLPSPPTSDMMTAILGGERIARPLDMRDDGSVVVTDLGVISIVRSDDLVGERWGPLLGPDGAPIAAVRVVVGMPTLRGDVIEIILTNATLALVTIVGLWFVVWLALLLVLHRPMAALAATVNRIRAGQMGVRAPVHADDELGRLAVSFNDMADDLERRASVDSLTGLLNHRAGQQALDVALERATTRARPLSIVIGDVDGFKMFNDLYGHPIGDEVLKIVANVLTWFCQGGAGIPCRHGGDEFLVILPDHDEQAAAEFAAAVRARLRNHRVPVETDVPAPLAMSLGIATLSDRLREKDQLLAHADLAMYEAKRGGIKGVWSDPAASAGRSSGRSLATLDALMDAIQYRDHYTKQHCDLVAEYGAKLAVRVGLSDNAVRSVRIAGLLHDVGKIVLPDDVLKKPGELSAYERTMVQRHPTIGEMLVRETTFMEDVVSAVGSHHERFDGSGYPRGLRGGEIPILGRIIAIADAYSAMVLDRPYRRALSPERIVGELTAGKGGQFDPDLIAIFIDILHVEAAAATSPSPPGSVSA